MWGGLREGLALPLRAKSFRAVCCVWLKPPPPTHPHSKAPTPAPNLPSSLRRCTRWSSVSAVYVVSKDLLRRWTRRRQADVDTLSCRSTGTVTDLFTEDTTSPTHLSENGRCHQPFYLSMDDVAKIFFIQDGRSHHVVFFFFI